MPKQALTILNTIAATSSKLEKEKLLKDGFTASPLLRKIVLAALDPFVTYGLAKVPAYEAPGFIPNASFADEVGTMTMNDQGVWDLLGELAERRITGLTAQDAVSHTLYALDEDSRELFKRVLLRDLRAGFGENTVNKVEKGAIKTFPYMRCSLPDGSNMGSWAWENGIVVQLKADGMFVNVSRGLDNEVWMTTRAGTPVPMDCDQLKFLGSAIANTLKENTQSHGELTVYHGGKLLSRKEGNGLLNSVLSGEGKFESNHRVVVDLWDQIPMSAVQPKGKFETPYIQRLKELASQIRDTNDVDRVAVRIIPTKVVKSKAEAFTIYKSYLTQGCEGVICKNPQAIWRDGTSKDQVKLKLDFEVELEVFGFEPGTPGTKTEATFGSLKCKSVDGLLLVDVSGFADKLRLEIHNDREGWTGAIITVRANDVIDREDSEVKSLFLPRFIERRLDKTAADTLAQIEAIKKAAVEA